jgi:deoxyribonuclease-4
MRIGAHVDPAEPLAAAASRKADAIQFFLTDPQGYKTPQPRADAADLRASEVDVYVHAPYIVNVATLNNRIRIPSRKLMMAHAVAAAELGAKGLIVHGGHVGAGADLTAGFTNWRKAFEYAEKDGGLPLPILIENTAGGDNAMARRFDNLARLWDAVGDFGAGFCLDTCHAHAGGEELLGVVDRIKAITGRIDLVHCERLQGPRSTPAVTGTRTSDTGKIDPELVVAVYGPAGAPVIRGNPGRRRRASRPTSPCLRERAGS